MILHEKLGLITHIYFFKDCSALEDAQDRSAYLIDWIDNLECSNLVANGKRFGRADLGNGPEVVSQARVRLQYLCTTTPALLFSEIQGGSLLQAEILKKPGVQIACPIPTAHPQQRTSPGLLASLVQIEKDKRQPYHGGWLDCLWSPSLMRLRGNR